MFWWERITRRFLAFAAIVALVVFWAIPVAAVGTISNITFLTNKLPWLRWILKMPHALWFGYRFVANYITFIVDVFVANHY